MDVIVDRCVALDVHKKTVMAAVRTLGQRGEFSTFIAELEKLRDWLAAEGVTQVAMEATGVYWRRVWHVLEVMAGCELSCRRMLEALIAGERDPEVLAQMALTRVRPKIPELRKAMVGRFEDHHALPSQCRAFGPSGLAPHPDLPRPSATGGGEFRLGGTCCLRVAGRTAP